MGPGEGATERDRQWALQLGRLIAQQGWVLLTGGRNVGVMAAAHQGAHQCHGLTIGILPGDDGEGMAEAIDIPILTGIGHARNVINVLSSQMVIACGMGTGTASEVALALKVSRPVILLTDDKTTYSFFRGLGHDRLWQATSPEAAIALTKSLLAG